MNHLLVREVQPPLIYLGGDGRLNSTQSNKSIYYFFIDVLSLHRFSISFFVFESCESRGSRGERIDLGQPIAAALPDGIPPRLVGFRICKSTRRLSCVSRCRSGLLRRELRCITPSVEGTRDVFVCQHTFLRLRWGRSFEQFPACSCYEESVIKRLQSTMVTCIINLLM